MRGVVDSLQGSRRRASRACWKKTLRDKIGKKTGAMKLTIERGALLHALGHVQSVVERRNTIPILSNVLLEAKGDRLGLTATDMELAIVEQVAAEIGAPGAITVSAHTLYDIVRKLPEGS